MTLGLEAIQYEWVGRLFLWRENHWRARRGQGFCNVDGQSSLVVFKNAMAREFKYKVKNSDERYQTRHLNTMNTKAWLFWKCYMHGSSAYKRAMTPRLRHRMRFCLSFECLSSNGWLIRLSFIYKLHTRGVSIVPVLGLDRSLEGLALTPYSTWKLASRNSSLFSHTLKNHLSVYIYSFVSSQVNPTISSCRLQRWYDLCCNCSRRHPNRLSTRLSRNPTRWWRWPL